MAPLETRTTSAPPPRAAASTSTRWRTRAGSMPPAAVVSDDEPTLTTMRRAPATRLSRAAERSVVTAVPVGVVLAADLVGHRAHAGAARAAVGTLLPAVLVEVAGDVGARFLVGLRLHALRDLAAAVAGGTGLAQPLVLTATAEHLRTGLDAGLEVEDDRVVVGPDEDRVALLGTHPRELDLDAEPVQAVREEADGLLVAEVGLPHPALGLGAAHPPAVVGGDDLEVVAAVDGLRPEHDALGLGRGRDLAGRDDDLGHGEGQLAQAGAGRGADLEDAQAATAQLLDHHVGDVLAVRDVDLVEGDQPRPVLEAAVAGQLALDDLEVVEGVAAGLDGGRVDDVDQRGATLDVAQEVVAEATALGGTLDQAGHVGDHEGRLAGGDHAEVGDEGGERVVGDLGPRSRDRGDQRRLAGAREADQADVGDDLELEAYDELVAGLTQQREPGSLALGGGEGRVAETAAAAGCDDQRRPVADEVGQRGAVLGLHERAVGDGEDQVLAVAAVLVVTGALATVVGAALRAVVVVDEGRDARVDLEDDRPALAAVAAVGTAERLELLPLDRGHAVATSSGREVQRDLVDERGDGHGGSCQVWIGG